MPLLYFSNFVPFVVCVVAKKRICVYKSSFGLAWAQVEMKLDTLQELSMNACLCVGVGMSVCFYV